MTDDGKNERAGFEARLDRLREQAEAGTPDPARATAATTGYYGRAVVKAPVWTWEVPVYFFIGGLAGMAAVVALGAALASWLRPESAELGIVRMALRIACLGAVAAPLLLISDLGRPARFLHMLRVFKWRSPMSMGAWVLTAFSALVVPATVLEALLPDRRTLILLVLVATAPLGALLATYTGVLLGATANPAWSAHHRSLPWHFGTASLGAAASSIDWLLGDPGRVALVVIGASCAVVETALWWRIETDPRRDRGSALYRDSKVAVARRLASLLTGPAPLLAYALSGFSLAAVSWLLGSALSRHAWLAAGRASAETSARALAR